MDTWNTTLVLRTFIEKRCLKIYKNIDNIESFCNATTWNKAPRSIIKCRVFSWMSSLMFVHFRSVCCAQHSQSYKNKKNNNFDLYIDIHPINYSHISSYLFYFIIISNLQEYSFGESSFLLSEHNFRLWAMHRSMNVMVDRFSFDLIMPSWMKRS